MNDQDKNTLPSSHNKNPLDQIPEPGVITRQDSEGKELDQILDQIYLKLQATHGEDKQATSASKLSALFYEEDGKRHRSPNHFVSPSQH